MNPAYYVALHNARRIPKPGSYERMIVALLLLTGNRRRDGSIVFKLR